eukprot:35901-Rhodomonas_salina.1
MVTRAWSGAGSGDGEAGAGVLGEGGGARGQGHPLGGRGLPSFPPPSLSPQERAHRSFPSPLLSLSPLFPLLSSRLTSPALPFPS